MIDIKKHGIVEQLSVNDEIDTNVNELIVNGYTVLDSGLSTEQLLYLKNQLEVIYKNQAEECGGLQRLATMNDQDIVRAPLGYNYNFVNAIWTEPMKNFLAKIFKTGFVLVSQNGLLNRPNKQFYQTAYHRDLNYNHWTCSKPLAVTAILALVDFTEENGATFVVPNSHSISAFPDDSFVNKHEKQMCIKAGQYAIINSMTFHRAADNKSDHVRTGMAHVIAEPFFAQQINIPKMFEKNGYKKPIDERLANFLGYKWGTADSATDWRKTRMK